MRKFMKGFRHGEKGFTLIELLIVVAILGIIAAVVVPNVTGFFATGQVAAGNTEVANVETAAMAYYADNDGSWPANTNTDLVGGGYLSDDAVYDYAFDIYGKVSVVEDTAWPNDAAVSWSVANHKWEK